MKLRYLIPIGVFLGIAWGTTGKIDYEVRRAELEERIAAHCAAKGESMVTTKSGQMVCVRSLRLYYPIQK